MSDDDMHLQAQLWLHVLVLSYFLSVGYVLASYRIVMMMIMMMAAHGDDDLYLQAELWPTATCIYAFPISACQWAMLWSHAEP